MGQRKDRTGEAAETIPGKQQYRHTDFSLPPFDTATQTFWSQDLVFKDHFISLKTTEHTQRGFIYMACNYRCLPF